MAQDKNTIFGVGDQLKWDATPTTSDPSRVTDFGLDYNSNTKVVTVNGIASVYTGDDTLGGMYGGYVSAAVLDITADTTDSLALQFSLDSFLDGSGAHVFYGAYFISDNVTTMADISDVILHSFGAVGSPPAGSAYFGGGASPLQEGASAIIKGASGGSSELESVEGINFTTGTTTISIGSDGTNTAVVTDATDMTTYNQVYNNQANSTFASGFSGSYNLVVWTVHQVLNTGGAGTLASNIPGALGGADGFTINTAATDTSVVYDATAYYDGSVEASHAFDNGGSQGNYDTYINDDGNLDGISGVVAPALPTDPLIVATFEVGSPVVAPYSYYGTIIKDGGVYYNDGSALVDLGQQDILFNQSVNTTDSVTFDTINATNIYSDSISSGANLVAAAGWSNDGLPTAHDNATLLIPGVNVVTSMSFANEGVRLPPITTASLGVTVEISNPLGQELYIYPATGDTIDLVGTVSDALTTRLFDGPYTRIVLRCESVDSPETWSVKDNQAVTSESRVAFDQVDGNIVHGTEVVGDNIIAGISTIMGGNDDGFLMNALEVDTLTLGTGVQGDNPITRGVVEYTTVSSGKSATLPADSLVSYSGIPKGATVTIVNEQGSNSFQLYPASGDQIDTLGLDMPLTIRPRESFTFTHLDTGKWSSNKNFKAGDIYDTTLITDGIISRDATTLVLDESVDTYVTTNEFAAYSRFSIPAPNADDCLVTLSASGTPVGYKYEIFKDESPIINQISQVDYVLSPTTTTQTSYIVIHGVTAVLPIGTQWFNVLGIMNQLTADILSGLEVPTVGIDSITATSTQIVVNYSASAGAVVPDITADTVDDVTVNSLTTTQVFNDDTAGAITFEEEIESYSSGKIYWANDIGAAGLSSLTIDGVELLDGATSNTTYSTCSVEVVDDINNNTTVPNYTAVQNPGDLSVIITAEDGLSDGLKIAFTATGTGNTRDSALSGGIQAELIGNASKTLGSIGSSVVVTSLGDGRWSLSDTDDVTFNTVTATNLTVTNAVVGSVIWDTGAAKTASFTAVSGVGYFCDTETTGTFTVSLPVATVIGETIKLKDLTNYFTTNKLILDATGTIKIEGVDDTYELITNGDSVELTWSGSAEGWKVIAKY